MTAALPAAAFSSKNGEFKFVQRELLVPSATNPRQTFDPQRLAELAKTIAEHGIVEPILVRPLGKKDQLEIVAGERRWRAAGLAKAIEVPVIVRDLSDKQALEIQTIENAQREDLHPLEQAAGYERLIKDFGYSPEKIADAIGKSRAHVFQVRKLLALAPKMREAFIAGEMDTTLATVVARVPGHDLQAAAWKKLKDEFRNGFSFRQAADFIRKNFMLDLMRAPFDVNNATLVEKAGACSACPKRTGSHPDLFADVKNGNVCTDPVCFGQKRDAARLQEVKVLEEKGREVIVGADAKRIMPFGYVQTDSYSEPTRHCFEDPKRRTWAQLAKDAGVQPALIQDPQDGNLKPIINVKDVKKALEQKGVNMFRTHDSRREQTSYSARQRAIEEKHRLEVEIRKRVLAEIRGKVRKMDLIAPPVLVMTICGFWRHLWHEHHKRIARAWGWKDAPYREIKPERFKGLDAGELARRLMDLALVHLSTPNASATELAAAAKRWRVQDGKIRAGVLLEARQRKAAKAAAAKAKKAAKKKPAAKKAKPIRRAASAFLRPMQADKVLAAVIGDKPLPRTEITKKIWTYIKRNKLQDKKAPRFIVPDAKLRPILGGKKRVSLFEMTKYVTSHFKAAK